MLPNKLCMQKDFNDFALVIMPIIGEDKCITLTLIVNHIETDLNTNCIIDENKLKKLGYQYLIDLSLELIKILKTEFGYTDHLE